MLSAVAASSTNARPMLVGRAATGPHPKRQPWPVTLTVRTVPAAAGLRLRFDDQPLVTDSAGITRVTVQHDFAAHSLSLIDSAVSRTDSRLRFTRWLGQRDPKQAYATTVTGLPMRADYTITAAFTVQYPVAIHLIEAGAGDHAPLAAAQVSKITIKDDTGTVLTVPARGRVWLDGIRPLRKQAAIVAHRVTYAVQSVIVRGGNVVNAGQQVITPAVNQTLTLTAAFYDLTISAHDVMTGSAHPRSATVRFPDGTAQTVDFGPRRQVTLLAIPRGHYIVAVRAGPGVAAEADFVLSDSRTIDIAVISIRDLTIVAGAIILVAAALLLAGRHTQLRSALRARGRASAAGPIDQTPPPSEEIRI